MLELIFVLAVIGAHRVVDGDVFAGDVGVLAAENGGAGAVDIVAAVMLTLPLTEPMVLPIRSRVCSFMLLFSLLLPMVKPRPPPVAVRPTSLVPTMLLIS